MLILPKNPTFAERLGTGLGAGLSEGLSNAADYSQKLNLEKYKNELKGRPEDFMASKNALSAIGRMRDFVKTGKTGFSLGAFTPEGKGIRAGFDTAALQLEKLAADMVGKGSMTKQRFEFLKDRLPSSSKTDAENKRILDEWETSISESLGLSNPSSSESEMEQEKSSEKRMRFDLSNPEHKSKARQLYSKYKDKEKVREILRKEFEGI